MPHAVGTNYNREVIRAEHGGDAPDVYFAIHHGTQIRALRLRRSWNPKISDNPAQVWVAKGPERELWGERLAMDTGAVHLYVGDTDDEDAYTYMGIYHVIGNMQAAQELAEAERTPGIEALSRIVLLRPA